MLERQPQSLSRVSKEKEGETRTTTGSIASEEEVEEVSRYQTIPLGLA
jgi:hypothetical protein